MLELAASEIVKAAIAVAKDILGDRVKNKNADLLAAKRKKADDEKKRDDRKNKQGLSTDELSNILLFENEEAKADLIAVEESIITNMSKHTENVRHWCDFVSFRDMSGNKSLQQIYVELDIFLMPLRTHIDRKERAAKRVLNDAVFSDTNHVVVLGQPGAGKTTSMKKICWDFFNGSMNHCFTFPILIRFRDISAKQEQGAIVTILSELLGVDVSANKFIEDELADEWRESIIYSIIDNLKPLIILDGFDELPTQRQKDYALAELRQITTHVKNAKVITTCRTGEFNYHLDHTNIYEISSLSIEQIKTFAQRWIGDKEKADKFICDIENSPFADTAIKPLSLAHLCAIYDRIGSIPDRPKTVYKKVVSLMLEQWDEQRSIKRESKYAKFEPDRKFEFLSHLSYYLTVKGATAVFTQEQLINAYKAICCNFSLPEDQSHIASDEIESHTGLFIQTGYLQYEFAHKSIQEYLTAEYLVGLPSLGTAKKYVEILGAELAIATSISSNPSIYFSDIVLGVFNRGQLTDSFYNAFRSRLTLEKPDFYPSEELVLAAFSLLSQRTVDNEYVVLMENMLEKSDLQTIAKYYELEENGDDGTLILKRIKLHDDYKLKPKMRVPNGIFAKYLTNIL